METLINLRSTERIVELDDRVDNAALVEVKLAENEGAVLVFTNYSDDMVDVVLTGIHPKETGYVFFASELLVDPVNNVMVPKHRLATADEIHKLKDRHIPLDKLPVLRMLDPIRRWNNWSRDSIIAIERPDGTYFRLVQ